MGFKSHIKKKKTVSRPGSPGSPGFRVDPPGRRVWPGCCHSRSFIKPRPVQPPDRPAGPGLINVLVGIGSQLNYEYNTCIFIKLR